MFSVTLGALLGGLLSPTTVGQARAQNCVPEAEVCDGVDNNCDGQTDEGQLDVDGDGVCDLVDACFGADDTVDVDGNGLPDGCNEGSLEQCSLQVCQTECIATQQAFYNDCDYCGLTKGNCADVLCLQSFGGCIPEEVCAVLYGEFVDANCNANAQAGCQQLALDDPPPTCQCPVLSSACIDECADPNAFDCPADKVCMDLDVGYACVCPDGTVDAGGACVPDPDGDGFVGAEDCGPADPETHVGAEEVCDGVDNDCDDATDEDLADSDSDGVCDAMDQCDGSDDAMDSDGDGVADGCDACPSDALGDSDGDGSCDSADLCVGDDTSGDADGDGFCALDLMGAVVDCEDGLVAVAPGAEETCNGVDDDCDGDIDEEQQDTDGDGTCDANDACVGDDNLGDTDGDGVCDDLDVCQGDDASGDADGDGACAEDVTGATLDCDDGEPAVAPGTDELCDGLDNDCDGDTDEGACAPDPAPEQEMDAGSVADAQPDAVEDTGPEPVADADPDIEAETAADDGNGSPASDAAPGDVDAAVSPDGAAGDANRADAATVPDGENDASEVSSPSADTGTDTPRPSTPEGCTAGDQGRSRPWMFIGLLLMLALVRRRSAV